MTKQSELEQALDFFNMRTRLLGSDEFEKHLRVVLDLAERHAKLVERLLGDGNDKAQ